MYQLNMLTQKARRRQIVQLRMRQWLTVIAATVTVMVAGTAYLWHQGRTAAMQRRTLEARYQPMADLQAELIGLRRTINKLQAREQQTLALATSRPAVSLLGAVAQAAQAGDAQVYVTQIEFGTDTSGQSQLAIHGSGQSSLAIAQFLAELRKSPVFSGVEFQRSETADQAAGESQTFYANCQL